MFGSAPHISSEEILLQLQRILSSESFDASARNRRFLKYVVTETLDGRAGRIKAYTIATCVMGRGSDFDPQEDAIVRIEAGRLRRSLELYYLTSKGGDPIRITIPLGGYVPEFSAIMARPVEPAESGASATPSASRLAAERRFPSILVTEFEQEGDPTLAPNFASGFTRTVITGLTRFTELNVYGPAPGRAADRAAEGDAAKCGGIDFILRGGAAISAGRIAIDALLVDAFSGRYLWAENFRLPSEPAEVLRLRDEIADRVVQALARPTGVIFSAKAHEHEGKPPADWDAFDAVMSFHHYSRDREAGKFETVRLALERAITCEPDYAQAHACLALIYIDGFRFGYLTDRPSSAVLNRALELARRAIDLSPNSSCSHLAFALAQWFLGHAEAGMQALATSLSMNPNDTEVMAELGMRHALRENWDEAEHLLREAYRRNLGLAGNCRVGLALMHYVRGEYESALAEALRITATRVIPTQVMLAIAAAKLNRHREAAEAVATILALDPFYGARVVRDLQARNLTPRLVGIVVAGLREAGLPVTDPCPADPADALPAWPRALPSKVG